MFYVGNTEKLNMTIVDFNILRLRNISNLKLYNIKATIKIYFNIYGAIHSNILSNMFRPVLRPSSGRSY
jgi:hypothetical protein